MTNMLGLYRPRRTPLHLLPAWIKVLALVTSAITIMSIHNWLWSAAAVTTGAALLVSTLPPPRATLRGVAFFSVMAALGSVFHWWRGDPVRGLEIALNLMALILIALAVTSSTSMEAMLGFVSFLARPFSRWIPTEAIGLLVSLMIRSVPEATRILGESREAARARGLGRDPRAILLPTGVRTVAYALRVGDAITARGLADEATTTGAR